ASQPLRVSSLDGTPNETLGARRESAGVHLPLWQPSATGHHNDRTHSNRHRYRHRRRRKWHLLPKPVEHLDNCLSLRCYLAFDWTRDPRILLQHQVKGAIKTKHRFSFFLGGGVPNAETPGPKKKARPPQRKNPSG